MKRFVLIIFLLCAIVKFMPAQSVKEKTVMRQNNSPTDITQILNQLKNERYRALLQKFRETHPEAKIMVTEYSDRFELLVTHPASANRTGGAEQYFIDKATGKVTMGWHEHPMELQSNIVSVTGRQENPAARSIAQSSNAFGFDLYRGLDSKDKNLFFAPYNVFKALTMVYEGAEGETAAEMRNVLHLSADLSGMRAGFKALFCSANDHDRSYRLSTANALWVQQSFPLSGNYLQIIEQYYMGKVENLDFTGNPAKASRIINQWVARETDNRIKGLISPRAINPLTRLIITTAIYFKGNWAKQFKAQNTRTDQFTRPDGSKIDVKMMAQTGDFHYGETNELQILEMDYQGKELSMLILLPKANDLGLVETYLSPERFDELTRAMKTEKVIVEVPKFKMEIQYLLADKLKAMGMPTAFQYPGADFSKMSPDNGLYISQIIHKSFIEVAEYGTEAAAATAVVSVGSTAIHTIKKPPKLFRADHPFIFVIRQKATGNVLFLGRVCNPKRR